MLKKVELYSCGVQVHSFTVKESDLGSRTKCFTTVNDIQIVTDLDFFMYDHPDEKKED